MRYISVKNFKPDLYPQIENGFYKLNDIGRIFLKAGHCPVYECRRKFKSTDSDEIIDHVSNRHRRIFQIIRKCVFSYLLCKFIRFQTLSISLELFRTFPNSFKFFRIVSNSIEQFQIL